jgi:hypothetical protein
MLNPLTNKDISENGRVFKKLINDGFIVIEGILTPPDTNGYIQTPEGYIHVDNYFKTYSTINPDTGRIIKYPSAKKKTSFTIHTDGENDKFYLIPNDKTEYAIHIDNHWLLKGSKAHTHAMNANEIKVKTVHVSENEEIDVNSGMYNRLIADGYKYDEKTNLLSYPVEIFTLKISSDTKYIDIKTLILKNLKNVYMVFGDGTHINVPFDNIARMTTFIHLKLRYNDTPCLLHCVKAEQKIMFGVAFRGDKNCVIVEAEKHCSYHKYNIQPILNALHIKFKNGVYGNDYEYISKKLQMAIVVSIPDGCKITWGKNRKQRAMLNINYNNNHVWKERQNKKNVVINEGSLFDGLEPTNIVNIWGDMKDPIQIETRDKILRVSHRTIAGYTDDIPVSMTNNISVISYYMSAFIKSNKIEPITKHNFNIDAIKSLCNHGIMFSKNSPVVSFDNYDLKKAYSTYKKCDYYNGFPTDLSYCISITDLETALKILKTHEGFASVMMRCIWTDKLITRWVSFPYLRHYIDKRDSELTVFYMMISRSSTELDLSTVDVNKRMWHWVLGAINKTKKLHSYTTTDSALAVTANGHTETFDLNGTMVYRKTNKYDGVSNEYYPYIPAYVQHYTEIRMEQFVLDNKINIDDILKVWVDGIYIRSSKKIKNDAFHYNDGRGLFEEIPLTYSTHNDPVYYCSQFNSDLGMSNLVKGTAGTGKTFLCKALHQQTPNSIILTPTNELKRRAYEGCNVHTIDMVCTRPFDYAKYSTFYIDEYGVISQEKLDKLCEFNNARIILFGDTAQLKLIEGTPINENNWRVLLLEKIWRQIDPKFQRKLQLLRDSGIFKFNKKISVKDAIENNAIILSSTHVDIDTINSIGVSMVEGEEIQGLKKNVPVRFYKTDKKKYFAGEYGKITELDNNNMGILKDDDVHVNMSVEHFKKKHKPSYSVSFHSQQGRTIKARKVAINLKNLFDDQMVYVGCSRVENEDQLYELDW